MEPLRPNKMTRELGLVLVSSSLILGGCHRQTEDEKKRDEQAGQASPGAYPHSGYAGPVHVFIPGRSTVASGGGPRGTAPHSVGSVPQAGSAHRPTRRRRAPNMQRHTTEIRPNWQEAVESKGMYYHSVDGIPYWDESAYYEFTPGEVDTIEAATYELDRICLEAVQHVIDEDRFDEFLIPEEFRPYIRRSWQRDKHTIYGRFDLACDGTHPPKMLEYNADTPTGLLEAAVTQWFWLQDKFPTRNQFNSIHERLIEAWQAVKQSCSGSFYLPRSPGSSRTT